MFGLEKFKLVKELKNIKPQLNWLKFSSSQRQEKVQDELLNSLMEENKFIEEELRIRAMVEDMLQKEFSPEIKNSKSYDFLVDSVVSKLKQKQLGNIEDLED